MIQPKASAATKGKVPVAVLTQDHINSLIRDRKQVLGESASYTVFL